MLQVTSFICRCPRSRMSGSDTVCGEARLLSALGLAARSYLSL